MGDLIKCQPISLKNPQILRALNRTEQNKTDKNRTGQNKKKTLPNLSNIG